MPRLESTAGDRGADGVVRASEAPFIPGVQEVSLAGGRAGALRLPIRTRSQEPTEPDPITSDFLGRFGKTGAAFIPEVRRTAQPTRLPGPVQFVVKLLEFWRLDKSDAPQLLGFDQEDGYYVASVLEGVEQIRGRDVRERIAHLFRIRSILSALFRDRETENSWLRERHSLLRDKAPMDLMLGGSMEDLLLVRDYVERAAGW